MRYLILPAPSGLFGEEEILKENGVQDGVGRFTRNEGGADSTFLGYLSF